MRLPGATAFLSLLLLASASRAGDVDLSATMGFAGRYRQDAFNPVRVTIANRGEMRRFELRIPGGGYGADMAYAAEVQIPRGNSRDLELDVFVGIGLEAVESPSGMVQGLRVLLADEDGRIVAETIAPGEPVGREERLVLLCGLGRKLPAAFEDRDVALAVRVAPGDLPSSPEALEGVNAVVLADAGSLLGPRPEKAEVLRRWLLSGGRIVAWGDASFFDAPPPGWGGFVPRPAGPAIPVRSDVSDISDRLSLPPDRDGPAVVRLEPGGWDIVLQDREGTLGVSVREGTGKATFLTLDPASPVLSGDAPVRRFQAALLGGAAAKTDGDGPFEFSERNGLRDAVANREGIRLPRYWAFLAAFLVFAGVVGPGVSLVVGRRRGPWVWVAVILLSGAVSGGVFGYALLGRTGEAGIRQVTVVDCDAAGEAGSYRSVFGLFSPDRRRFDLDLPAGSRAACALASRRRWGRGRDPESAATGLEMDVFCGAIRAPMAPYSARAFRAAGPLPPEAALTIHGGIRVVLADGRWRVVNRTSLTLEEGRIEVGKYGYTTRLDFGTIAPGEEADARESKYSGGPGGNPGDSFPTLWGGELGWSCFLGERGSPFDLRGPGPGTALVLAAARAGAAPAVIRGRESSTEELLVLRMVVRIGQ
jgi:hypothetical protein